MTKYHGLGSLNGRNSFSHGSEDWKSKIKVLSGLVSSKPLPLAYRWPSSLYLSSECVLS